MKLQFEVEVPCNIGTPVYVIVDKCLAGLECPFNGGRAYSTCDSRKRNCDAYYITVPFRLGMENSVGEDVFLSEEEAKKEVNKLNGIKEVDVKPETVDSPKEGIMTVGKLIRNLVTADPDDYVVAYSGDCFNIALGTSKDLSKCTGSEISDLFYFD